jgi:hypothetical protein
MNRTYTTFGAAMTLLAATCLPAATPAPRARIALVEHSGPATPGAQGGADPSIARKQLPGEAPREAHIFAQKLKLGASATETIEVVFNDRTTLGKIGASNDFHVISGGTCNENQIYSAGERCTVDVLFKSTGPGKRAGRLTFATAESVTPEVVGLQGDTYGAALAFTPAQITTLPQSAPNGSPLLYAPGDVAVDQGDNLYVSDQWVGAKTASGRVYMMDSGEQLNSLVGGGTTHVNNEGGLTFNSEIFLNTPIGIATDSFLDLYTAESANNTVDISTQNLTRDLIGQGSGNPLGCTASSAPPSCNTLNIAISDPTWINVDNAGNLYFTDENSYYFVPWIAGEAKNLINLSGYYNAGLASGDQFGIDAEDNFYTMLFTGDAACQVGGWTPNSNFEWIVAGSGLCAYAGNNVRSQNAEIGPEISGYATDAAGNLYFTDAFNNVLRRVDAYNGLIRTVAGNNALGANYTGDGGPATDATLNSPIGVAVNSNGVIYTASYVNGVPTPYVTKKAGNPEASETIKPEKCIGNCGPTTSAVIRQIGPAGQRNFPTTIVGKSSPVSTILLTNVGNDYLNVSKQLLTGDTGDFLADPATSSCNWSAALPPGQSCQLGFACTPKAIGVRTATVTFVDNTATFQNTLNLECIGIGGPVTPTVVINPPANGAQYYNGATVPVTISVFNNITQVPTPPTGTVTLTVTNATSKAVVGTYGPIALTTVAGKSESLIVTSFPGLALGNYSVTAAYSGDALDTAASSAATLFSIIQTTPVITFTLPAASSKYSYQTAVPIHLTVSNANAFPIPPNSPSGSVTLALTNLTTKTVVAYGPFTLTTANNGVSTFVLPTPIAGLTVANYSLIASYSGDTVDTTATATQLFSVIPVVPTLSWPALTYMDAGWSLNSTELNATITSPSGLAGKFVYNPPAGTLENTAGDVTLKVTFTPTDTLDYATVTGTNSILVISSSAVPRTSTALASKSNPAHRGQTVELSVSVKPETGNATPTGSITLSEAGKILTTATLTAGAGKLTVSGLTPGTHTLTARYSGDKQHAASTSEPLQQIVVTVNGAPVGTRTPKPSDR